MVVELLGWHKAKESLDKDIWEYWIPLDEVPQPLLLVPAKRALTKDATALPFVKHFAVNVKGSGSCVTNAYNERGNVVEPNDLIYKAYKDGSLGNVSMFARNCFYAISQAYWHNTLEKDDAGAEWRRVRRCETTDGKPCAHCEQSEAHYSRVGWIYLSDNQLTQLSEFDDTLNGLCAVCGFPYLITAITCPNCKKTVHTKKTLFSAYHKSKQKCPTCGEFFIGRIEYLAALEHEQPLVKEKEHAVVPATIFDGVFLMSAFRERYNKLVVVPEVIGRNAIISLMQEIPFDLESAFKVSESKQLDYLRRVRENAKTSPQRSSKGTGDYLEEVAEEVDTGGINFD